VPVSVTEKDGGLEFYVRVQPRASWNETAGEREGAVRVRITAPPVEGAANKALAGFLAERLGVPKSAVEIVSGQTGRYKRVRVLPSGGAKELAALKRAVLAFGE
jgi:uncharacterized protein (TIGR00251 family)